MSLEFHCLTNASSLREISGQIVERADFVPERELAPILEARQILDQALSQADGRLLAGLIGGTGVGKSSLIGALAQAPISAVSAIRPTTDKPVVYRHRSHQIKLPSTVEAVEAVHELPGLADLALVDLPDFDSLKEAHAEMVLEILPKLDLLIWVTTPLKYADRGFYRMLNLAGLRLSPRAQVFILNKTDQLLERYGPTQAPQIIADLTADFSGYLKKWAGFDEPVVWALSALKAQGEPQELEPVWEFLEQLSELKARRLIEEANIGRKAEILKARLLEALPPEKLHRLAKELKRLPEKWAWEKRAAKTVDLAKPSGKKYQGRNREEIIAAAPAGFRLAFDLAGFVKSLAGKKPGPAGPDPDPEASPSTEVFTRPWVAAWEDLKSIWPWNKPPRPLRAEGTMGWPPPEELAASFNQESGKTFQRHLASRPQAKTWPWWLSALPLLLIPLTIWAETIGRPLAPGAFMAALWRGLPPLLILLPLAYLGLGYFNLYRQGEIFQRRYEKALAYWGQELVSRAEARLNRPVRETASHLENLAAQLTDLPETETASAAGLNFKRALP